jgi:hypothetical protein
LWMSNADWLPSFGASGSSEPVRAGQFVDLNSRQQSSDLKNLTSLIDDTRKIIESASGDCAKLLGKDALNKFNEAAKNIEFNGDIPIDVEHPFHGLVKGVLSDAPGVSAVTNLETGQISLNPSGWAFNTYTRGGQPYHPLQKDFKKFGVSQRQYALAVMIHEFLHAIGKFGSDFDVGLDGKINFSKSQDYQKEVLKKCFPKKKK